MTCDSIDCPHKHVTRGARKRKGTRTHAHTNKRKGICLPRLAEMHATVAHSVSGVVHAFPRPLFTVFAFPLLFGVGSGAVCSSTATLLSVLLSAPCVGDLLPVRLPVPYGGGLLCRVGAGWGHSTYAAVARSNAAPDASDRAPNTISTPNTTSPPYHKCWPRHQRSP